MVHFCAVPECNNNSNTKDKKLIKIWIHKIGQKNLSLNGNTRICSEHFVNSANRRLRPDEFPSINLPVLSTTVRKPPRRRSPLLRGAAERRVHSDESDEEESGIESVIDRTCCTDLTANHIEAMEEEIRKLKEEIYDLKQENALSKFTLSNVANRISFYTYHLKYWNSKVEESVSSKVEESISSKVEESVSISKRKGRPRSLEPLEEFFLVLVRLRLGLMEQDIADRFGLSCSIVSRIFATWINFLYLKLKEIPLWPPRDVITSKHAQVF